MKPKLGDVQLIEVIPLTKFTDKNFLNPDELQELYDEYNQLWHENLIEENAELARSTIKLVKPEAEEKPVEKAKPKAKLLSFPK